MNDINLTNTIVPSYNEVRYVINKVNAALAQGRIEDCGTNIFEARKILRKYGMTMEDIYRLWFEYHPNDIVMTSTTAYETTAEPPKSLDPDDYWIRPWAELMEERLIDNRYVRPGDKRTIRRMLEYRDRAPRSCLDVEWLYDIAYRNVIPIPNEWSRYYAEHKDEIERLKAEKRAAREREGR